MRTVIARISAVVVLGWGACGGKTTTADTAGGEPAGTTVAPATEPDTVAPAAVADTATIATTEATEADTATVATVAAAEADAATGAPAEADTAPAPTAEADTATPPTGDDGDGSLRLPKPGAVPAERLATLSVDAARPDPSPLARVARCGSHPDVDGCGFLGLLGVVGFKDGGQVALVSTVEVGSCAEVDRLVGRVATLDDLAAGASKVLADPSDHEEPSARGAWAWLVRIAKDGFAPARDLIKASGSQPSGIRAHTPTVMLGPPLDGWLVDAVDGKDAVTWRLVPPDNATAHVLGSVPHVRADCNAEDRNDGLCADFTYPSVLQVVLTPDGTKLLATTALGDGTHCGSDRVQHVLWTLPAGVTPSP